MKQYIPDLLAIFRIISAPVILYLILLDGSNEGLMLIPAIIAFIAAWTDFFAVSYTHLTLPTNREV